MKAQCNMLNVMDRVRQSDINPYPANVENRVRS